MLVKGQSCFVVVVLEKIVAEPMWKRCIDAFHFFPEPTAAERGTAAAGIIRNHDGESLVVKNLNLNVDTGEFLTMLGPSGRKSAAPSPRGF